MGHEDFWASVGWLDEFIRRHDITQISICIESVTADSQPSGDWKNKVLPHLMRQFHKLIFLTLMERVFLWMFTNKTLTFEGQKCSVAKNSRENCSKGFKQYKWFRMLLQLTDDGDEIDNVSLSF